MVDQAILQHNVGIAGILLGWNLTLTEKPNPKQLPVLNPKPLSPKPNPNPIPTPKLRVNSAAKSLEGVRWIHWQSWLESGHVIARVLNNFKSRIFQPLNI